MRSRFASLLCRPAVHSMQRRRQNPFCVRQKLLFLLFTDGEARGRFGRANRRASTLTLSFLNRAINLGAPGLAFETSESTDPNDHGARQKGFQSESAGCGEWS